MCIYTVKHSLWNCYCILFISSKFSFRTRPPRDDDGPPFGRVGPSPTSIDTVRSPPRSALLCGSPRSLTLSSATDGQPRWEPKWLDGNRSPRPLLPANKDSMWVAGTKWSPTDVYGAWYSLGKRGAANLVHYWAFDCFCLRFLLVYLRNPQDMM